MLGSTFVTATAHVRTSLRPPGPLTLFAYSMETSRVLHALNAVFFVVMDTIHASSVSASSVYRS